MRPLPPLGPNRPLKLPKTVERTLANGLTVIAIRRSAVPLVEVRLRVPFARANLARAAVLTQTLLSGTDDHVDRARSPPSCRRSAAGCPPAPTRTGC